MTLLARYAECAFWMARYVERVENLADGAGPREIRRRLVAQRRVEALLAV